jgi:hypothetical protein
MAKTTKPTKQQVAQAKARAGGNNPVKVTNAGLKKLGGAALIAASMTPAGRAVKGATVAAKTAGTVAKALAGSPKVVRKAQAVKELKRNKKIVEEIARMQEKTKAEKIANRSVKTRPEDKIKRMRDNVDSYYKTVKAKSGATAKQDAAEAAKTNYRKSPYKENQVVTVKSGNAKPYKITGGAGSTARRAGEVIKRTKKSK